jgi:hypothetical protein
MIQIQPPADTSRAGSGASVIELIAAIAVTGMAMAIGVPLLDDARRAAALNRSAAQVQGLLVRSRSVAVLRSRACGVVFDRTAGGGWCCYVAEDGNGDGIRRADIDSGTDVVVGPTVELEAGCAGPGILTDGPVPDPSGRGNLGGDLDDPIRAGRGNIITFTSRGTATPSSVYLSDHRRRMIVFRVYGGTARIHRRTWHRGLDRWR